MARTLLMSSPGAAAPGDLLKFAPVVSALVLMLLAGAALAGEQETRDAKEFFFTPTFGDLPEEMQVARDEGKLGMLLFFEAESCPYCVYMLRKVLNQKSVQDWYRERFVNIAVDIHGDVEFRDFDGITLPSKVFADHRRIYLTPVVSFLNLDGTEIYRHLGMIKTPEEFLILGEYIEGQHYFDTEYELFARKRGLAEREDVLLTPAGESE
jgi:thioredoxin-related protein